jgi:hypothetical protein
MGTKEEADVLAIDGGLEWRDIAHELQRMGKWPTYTSDDEAAAVATLKKDEADEAAQYKAKNGRPA